MEGIEVYKCTACGFEDTIYFTQDIGYCTECGTPEHYKLIEEYDGES